MSVRCADLSRAAGEELSATASTAHRWLLLEVPGAWPRDVGDPGALPAAAHRAVRTWLESDPGSRLQFIRRPGRTNGPLLAFVVRAEETVRDVLRIELASHLELARIDLDTAGAAVETSLLLVCGHGSRDRCCATRGTPVFGALAERLGEEELWTSSHQGGHRFAANLLVLPAGLQFGRLGRDEAPLVAARALADRIALEHYRGRTCYEPRVQAAEVAVRRAACLEGVGELELESATDGVVVFRTWNGGAYRVTVEESNGPVVPASCGDEPLPQRHFAAGSVARLNDGADTRDR